MALDAIQGLVCTKDEAEKASCDAIADYLAFHLNAFSKRGGVQVLLPKQNTIRLLRKSALQFFEKELPATSFKVHELTTLYLPLAAHKWALYRAQVQATSIAIDEEAESWLVEEPDRAAQYQLDVLVLPRDTLFTLQTVHHFARRFALLHRDIGVRICHHAETGLLLAFENGYFSYTMAEGADRERRLHTMCMSACRQVAKHGVEKAEIFIKELIEYKKDQEHIPAFYARLVAFLELNELQYHLATLLKEWPKIWFTCGTMIDSDEKFFHHREFLPRQELVFLTRLQEDVIKCMDGLCDYDLVSRFFYMQKVAETCLDVLGCTPIDSREEFYLSLDATMLKLVDKSKEKIKALKFYNELYVYDTDDSDDENKEEYSWKPVGNDEYKKIIMSIKGLCQAGVSLCIPKSIKEIRTKKVSTDRGFLPQVPPRPIKAARQKKKKQPSNSLSSTESSSVSPELLEIPLPSCSEAQELTQVVAKLTFLEVARAQIALAPQVVTRKPKIVCAPLNCAERVRRWYLERWDPAHPYNCDPEYRNIGKNAASVSLEHAIGRWLDFYFKNGVLGPPSEEYSYAERRQLIISVTYTTLGGKEITKTGTITWARDPEDGLVFHRWFVKRGKKTEHFDLQYAENSYAILAEDFPLPPPPEAPPQVIERDGSYLEFQSGKRLIINAPKHKARIRAVLP